MATTALPTLESGKYYPAFLDIVTNNVYIGPEINEAYALGIVAANTKHFGVFTWSHKDATSLVSKLGTPISDPAHGDSGYYKHYHVMWPNSKRGIAHVWYFV